MNVYKVLFGSQVESFCPLLMCLERSEIYFSDHFQIFSEVHRPLHILQGPVAQITKREEGGQFGMTSL